MANMAGQVSGIQLMTSFIPRLSGLVLVWPLLLHAQTSPLTSNEAPVKLIPPVGVNLGEWLTQDHPDLAGRMYAPGLIWLEQSEAQKQAQDKTVLLQGLDAWADQNPQTSRQREALKQLLETMPVTGRRKLMLQDPWLMQTHRQLAPITSSDDQILVPPRPDRVRVINADALLCDVRFEPTRWAIDYLKTCGVHADLDEVWLIQPNGQTTRLAINAWNAQTQEAPAPGAWLWVSSAVVSPHLNHRIAQFLSTQGVAHGNTTPLPLPLPPSDAPKTLPISTNDWGITGLMQTPTARTPRAGLIGLTVYRAWPYNHISLSMSPFDTLELGMRYTNISNRLYGPSIAGDQSYKDKSSDIKWRVVDEAATHPAIAIGLRDPGGTGLFGGEYVVASKRWHNFDMSLGIGWGYLGAGQNMPNPLKIFGSRFANRANSDIGAGGTAQISPLFTGKTALFGGVQWQTPINDLVLKVELDGNNYQHEPLNNEIGGARSPLNWGLAWQKGPMALSLGYERGQRWMLGLSLSTDLPHMSRTKSSEPAPWPVNRPAASTLPSEPASQITRIQTVKEAIALQTGWTVDSISQDKNTWVIALNQVRGISLPERLDRGMAVAHELAPDHIQSFHFVLMQQGVPVSSRVIDRATWADARYAWRGQVPVHASVPAEVEMPQAQDTSPLIPTGSVNLGYQQNIGGPDGYLYAFSASAKGQWPLWQGGWVEGSVNGRLIDNYDNFHYTAPSSLPRVRTYMREYLTGPRLTLKNAQITQLNQWRDDVYSLAYAGALESMFAGIGAEVMWRPHTSQWALGVDINRLSQREFDQRLSLRDYRVTSGHMTAYWDTRWQGVEAKLMVGQYLAGDRGATLEVARRFSNGARMGAWMTKTNVPSQVFGEGSFDKGVFFSVPFDAFLTAWSNQTMKFAWQPLIRDGGARLNKTHALWDLTNSRDEREWMRSSAP